MEPMRIGALTSSSFLKNELDSDPLIWPLSAWCFTCLLFDSLGKEFWQRTAHLPGLCRLVYKHMQYIDEPLNKFPALSRW